MPCRFGSFLWVLVTAVALPFALSCARPSPQESSTQQAAYLTQKPGKWALVWSDDFDTEAIDASKWSLAQDCFGGGNNELQCYTARSENAAVEKGYLRLTAKKEPYRGLANPAQDAATLKTQAYTSARVSTQGKFDFTYGRVCVRAKLPFGQGLWPAIWMMPTASVYGAWAASGEIDIMEAINLPQSSTAQAVVFGALHYGAETPHDVFSLSHYRFAVGQHPSTKFHTYCLEWEETELRWYVDEQHYASQRQWYAQNATGLLPYPAPFDQDFHLILNVAVGGTWPGPPNAQTRFPQSLLVDWVRVYQCEEDPQSGSACGVQSSGASLMAAVPPKKL